VSGAPARSLSVPGRACQRRDMRTQRVGNRRETADCDRDGMDPGATPCEDVPPLRGSRVGVTAHRRADEQAELLARRGAEVMLGPIVRTLPLGDARPLAEATYLLLRHPPDLLVATTAIGMRSWFGAAETWGIDDTLGEALGAARIASRGPKARAALSAAGLASQIEDPSERLDRLMVDVHTLVTGPGRRSGSPPPSRQTSRPAR
jgi:uroporphyrinogen-III synthase